MSEFRRGLVVFQMWLGVAVLACGVAAQLSGDLGVGLVYAGLVLAASAFVMWTRTGRKVEKADHQHTLT